MRKMGKWENGKMGEWEKWENELQIYICVVIGYYSYLIIFVMKRLSNHMNDGCILLMTACILSLRM